MSYRSILACVLILSCAAAALGQASSSASSPPADKPFVVRAIVGSQSNVEAAKLAADKGGPKVKPAAEKLLGDHEKLAATLLALARQRNIHPPQQKTERHRRLMDRLSGLDGYAFDRAFAAAMVENHYDAVALFKRQVEYGRDDELKKLAADTLPALEEHLTASRALAKQLAAAATTTSRPSK